MSERVGGRWWLARGNREPRIWPFGSEIEATEFAVEHGLVDWRVERMDDPEVEHEAVCASCREPWPCEHEQLDRKASMIIRHAENTCARCGKQVGWLRVTFKGAGEFGEDLRYHGKLGACWTEAKRRAAETGDEGALADVAQVERMREAERQRRERAKEHKATMRRVMSKARELLAEEQA